jgi:hypothetical protein
MHKNQKLMLLYLQRRREQDKADWAKNRPNEDCPYRLGWVSVRRWRLCLDEGGKEISPYSVAAEEHPYTSLTPSQVRYALEALVQQGKAVRRDSSGFIEYSLQTEEDRIRAQQQEDQEQRERKALLEVVPLLSALGVKHKESWGQLTVSAVDLLRVLRQLPS